MEIQEGRGSLALEIWVGGGGGKKPCHLSGGGGVWIYSGITHLQFINVTVPLTIFIHQV